MTQFHLTTSLLGLGFAVLIFFLLRKDRLYAGHGVFWLAVAFLAGLLGLWPGLVDALARSVGISYSPALLLLVAILVLLVKSLHTDIDNTRMERQLRRLNQRLALMELEHKTSPREVVADEFNAQ